MGWANSDTVLLLPTQTHPFPFLSTVAARSSMAEETEGTGKFERLKRAEALLGLPILIPLAAAAVTEAPFLSISGSSQRNQTFVEQKLNAS